MSGKHPEASGRSDIELLLILTPLTHIATSLTFPYWKVGLVVSSSSHLMMAVRGLRVALNATQRFKFKVSPWSMLKRML